MYPDVDDVKRHMEKLSGLPRPDPVEIWADVVLARSFLEEAYGCCRNHGRHKLVPAATLKSEAERFTGKPISDYALMVALRMSGYTTRPSAINPAQFEKLEVKFPPISRFEEKRELWAAHQVGLEKEVEMERDEMQKRLRVLPPKAEVVNQSSPV
jgi:hypothetical protein